MTATSVLVIRGLHRQFGHREIIGGLDLSVEPGGRIALWGPNGSGKSTILRCIAGSVRPTSGRAEIGGHPAGSLAARTLIGTSFAQERSFYMRLDGRRNLVFYAQVRGYSRREAQRLVQSIADELHLEHILAERVDRCSSGMIQQLAVARALIGSPQLLLLDEPTRSLDEAACARLWQALHQRSRVAVVMATHRHEDVEQCGSRVELPLVGM